MSLKTRLQLLKEQAVTAFLLAAPSLHSSAPDSAAKIGLSTGRSLSRAFLEKIEQVFLSMPDLLKKMEKVGDSLIKRLGEGIEYVEQHLPEGPPGFPQPSQAKPEVIPAPLLE